MGCHCPLHIHVYIVINVCIQCKIQHYVQVKLYSEFADFWKIFLYLKNKDFIFLASSIMHMLTEELSIFAPISEKAMAPHSSTLAWKIPWTEEPGRLQFMGSLRVGHD